MFLVTGAERVQQLLQRNFVRSPPWLPRDGRQVRLMVELLNFGWADLENDGGVVYKCDTGGVSHGTPRRIDEVCISYVGYADGEEVANSRGFRWTQLGVGILPLGLEMALSREFRKDGQGTVLLKGKYLCRATGPDLRPELSGLHRALHHKRAGANSADAVAAGWEGDVLPLIGTSAVGCVDELDDQGQPLVDFDRLSGLTGVALFRIELMDWAHCFNCRCELQALP